MVFMNSLRSVRPIPAGSTKIKFLYTWGVDTVCYLTLSIMASYPIYSHNIDFYGVHECFAFPGVTPAHKGLTPSGLLCKYFFQRPLSDLPFKAHTRVLRQAG
jgi:hypothetical protein